MARLHFLNSNLYARRPTLHNKCVHFIEHSALVRILPPVATPCMPHLRGCRRFIALALIALAGVALKSSSTSAATTTTGIASAAPSTSAASIAGKLEVTPSSIVLDSPESTLQLLVSVRAADGRLIDVTRQAKYHVDTSSQAVPASVDALGLVEPLRDGKALIGVSYNGQSEGIPVLVKTVDHPVPISFPQDILPILTKTGCNTGGCHGKAEGMNGFKLSVFGFDPQGDHAALTMEGRGRRINIPAPDHSLILRKAIAEEPHGGGQRMQADSLRYKRMKRWIGEGAGYTRPDAPQIVRIEVEPTEQVMLARESRQVRVWAVDDTALRNAPDNVARTSNVRCRFFFIFDLV